MAHLTRRSEAFDNLFQVPQPAGSIEGRFKHTPVELNGITAGDFEWLILYMNGDH